MKKILLGIYTHVKDIPRWLWSFSTNNPQFKDWAVLIALIISISSYRNSIENTRKAEATYKSNLSKDSINMSNLKEINSNTKKQTEIINNQLEFNKQQLSVSQLLLKVSEKSIEEQINIGTPKYNLNADSLIYVDVPGIGIRKDVKIYKLEIKKYYSFTGSRIAYNVAFRNFFVINDEFNIKSFVPDEVIQDINPYGMSRKSIFCRYPQKVDKLIIITEVLWFDKLLNKQHSNTQYGEYDEQIKMFKVCISSEKNELFDKINNTLKEEKMTLLKPDY